MERLTIPAERLPDGGTRIQVVDARAVREHAMELYWRLKKYEDTGLSPDDVTDLMGSHAVAIGELAKMPKWIPVTERLPAHNKSVLVYCENFTIQGGHTVDIGSCDTMCEGHFWFLRTQPGVSSFPNHEWRVTHWMPLPKPPKEVLADA